MSRFGERTGSDDDSVLSRNLTFAGRQQSSSDLMDIKQGRAGRGGPETAVSIAGDSYSKFVSGPRRVAALDRHPGERLSTGVFRNDVTYFCTEFPMSQLSHFRRQLHRLRRRRALVRKGTAYSHLGLAILILGWSYFAIDWLFTLDPLQRAVVGLLFVSCLGWVLLRWVAPYVRVREQELDVALVVEQRVGIVSDLTAALQFDSPAAASWGSAQLRSALINRVADATRQINPLAGETWGRLPRQATLFVLATAVTAASVNCFPAYGRVFLNRLLLGQAPYPTQTQFARVIVNRQVVLDDSRGRTTDGMPAPEAAAVTRGFPVELFVEAAGRRPAAGQVFFQTGSSSQSRTLDLERLSRETRRVRLEQALALLNSIDARQNRSSADEASSASLNASSNRERSSSTPSSDESSATELTQPDSSGSDSNADVSTTTNADNVAAPTAPSSTLAQPMTNDGTSNTSSKPSPALGVRPVESDEPVAAVQSVQTVTSVQSVQSLESQVETDRSLSAESSRDLAAASVDDVLRQAAQFVQLDAPDVAEQLTKLVLLTDSVRQLGEDARVAATNRRADDLTVSATSPMPTTRAEETPPETASVHSPHTSERSRIASQTNASTGMTPIAFARDRLQQVLRNWPQSASPGVWYRAELGTLLEDCHYAIQLADARTNSARIQALLPPLIDLEFEVLPPEYAQGSEPVTRPLSRQFAVLEGSEIRLRAKSATGEPLQRVWIDIVQGDVRRRFELTPMQNAAAKEEVDRVTSQTASRLPDGLTKGREVGTVATAWQLEDQASPLHPFRSEFRFVVQAIDPAGAMLELPLEGHVRLRADRPPQAALELIHRVVLPTATPNVTYRIQDDFGIARAVLYVEVERQSPAGGEADNEDMSTPESNASADAARSSDAGSTAANRPAMSPSANSTAAAANQPSESSRAENIAGGSPEPTAARANSLGSAVEPTTGTDASSITSSGSSSSGLAADESVTVAVERHAIDLPLPRTPLLGDRLPFEGRYALALNRWKLQRGDRLKLTLQVSDERGPAQSSTYRSEPVVLEVTDEAGLLAAIAEADEQSERKLDEVIQQQLGIGDSP